MIELKSFEDLEAEADFDPLAKEEIERNEADNVYRELRGKEGLENSGELRLIFYEDPEDPDRFYQGPYGKTEPSKEHDYWSAIAEEILIRFPELQRGEHVGVKEIQRRLSKAKNLGYDVKQVIGINVSELKRDNAWDNYMEVKRDVSEKVRHHCPEVLEEIARRNEEQKELAWI